MVLLDWTKAATYSNTGVRVTIPRAWQKQVGLKPKQKVFFSINPERPDELIVTVKEPKAV